MAKYSENGKALRLIISVIPISAAAGTALLTWLGTSLFADKMSDIRKGSYNVISKRPKSGVAPVDRKGSVQIADIMLGEDTTFNLTEDA